MDTWYRTVQQMIDLIDSGIRSREAEGVTLSRLAAQFGYSPFMVSRKFGQISGMSFRDYVRLRRLAFALKDLRDTRRPILDVALDAGFASHQAFTRAFRDAYGLTPSAYRRHPVPLALRTLLRPLDCYLLGAGVGGGNLPKGEVKTYFVTIPAHKFLHIRSYESVGYWDFWQKQSLIPGQDCETICGLLDSIPDKLDDLGGPENNSGSGQIMGFLNAAEGRLCAWGIPLAECYGVRLPADYDGPVPPQMILMDVPEGEYLVFEHGPFDYENENTAVEQKIETAMGQFDYAAAHCRLDTAPGRIFYFYHDCTRYWKYVRPIMRI